MAWSNDCKDLVSLLRHRSDLDPDHKTYTFLDIASNRELSPFFSPIGTVDKSGLLFPAPGLSV